MSAMPATATAPMIQREIGDDRICVLTFDRPDSGANIFDAATIDESQRTPRCHRERRRR